MPSRATTRKPSTCGHSPRVRSGLLPREDHASNLVGPVRSEIGLLGRRRPFRAVRHFQQKMGDAHAEHAPEGLVNPAVAWAMLGAHVVNAKGARGALKWGVVSVRSFVLVNFLPRVLGRYAAAGRSPGPWLPTTSLFGRRGSRVAAAASIWSERSPRCGGQSAAGRETKKARRGGRSIQDRARNRTKTAPRGLEPISGCRVPRCKAQNGAPPLQHRTLLQEVRWRPPKCDSRLPSPLIPDRDALRTQECHPSTREGLGAHNTGSIPTVRWIPPPRPQRGARARPPRARRACGA